MNVFINAISITHGGGFVVLTHLLNAAIDAKQDITWYIAAEPNVIAQLPKSNSIIGLPCVWARKTPLHLMFWYEITLPKLLRNVKANVCFSQTNFLPRRSLPCPSLLLVHQAGYFSKKYQQLQSYWFNSRLSQFLFLQKIKWVKRSIKKASTVTIQTEALAKCISEQVKISKEKMVVVPHGAGLMTKEYEQTKVYPADRIVRIGYITKLGVQKDFDTAIHAIHLLKKKGISAKLILTLDEDDKTFYPMFCHVQQQIARLGMEDSVENYGNLSDPKEIKQLYESLDLFIFPSLCESFGFTLVEAMSVGLPVIAADTDSNREVTGSAGYLFSSENAEDLSEKISQFIGNDALYTEASQKSLARARDFSWDKTARTILDVLQQVAR